MRSFYKYLLLIALLVPTFILAMEKEQSVLGKRTAIELEIDSQETDLAGLDSQRIAQPARRSLPSQKTWTSEGWEGLLPVPANSEKKYKCNYEGCDFAFVQKNDLDRHIRTHTGEKPHKCTYEGCNYAAAQPGNLQRHIKKHTDERPFKCDYKDCNYAAARKDVLINHMKTMHPLMSLPTPVIAAVNQLTPANTPLPNLFPETELLESKENMEADSMLRKRGIQELELNLEEQQLFKIARQDIDKISNDEGLLTNEQLDESDEELISIPTPLIADFNRATPISTPVLQVRRSFNEDGSSIETSLPVSNHEKRFKCIYSGCDYTATQNELKYHIRVHTPASFKIHKCTYKGCNYASECKNTLDDHLLRHTGNTSKTLYKCTHASCDYTALRKDAIKSHLKSHSDERPYKCTQEGCNYSTKRNFNLNAHISCKHPDKMPFKCTHPGCNFAAKQAKSLNKHILNKHAQEANKPILKPILPNPISTQTSFANTLLSSQEPLISLPTPAIAAINQLTPVSTPVLQVRRSFNEDGSSVEGPLPPLFPETELLGTPVSTPALTTSSSSGLKAQPANNEKKYKCNYKGCDFAFCQKNDLDRHIRTHTGEKPHKCTYEGCNYAAAQPGNLQRHIKKHTDERPFKCDYKDCNYAAARKDVLINHMKTMHPLMSLPTPVIAAVNQLTPANTPLPNLFPETELLGLQENIE